MNRKWLHECVDFVRRGIVPQEPPEWQGINLDFAEGTISGGSRESWHKVIFDSENMSGIPARARVDGARLSEILKVLKYEEIGIAILENSLQIKAGTTEFNLPLLEGATGIPLEVSTESCKIELQGDQFLEAWSAVAWAAKPNAANFVLSCVGVFVEKNGTQALFVSTDARRLAVCGAECVGNAPKDSKPATGLLLAKRVNNATPFIGPNDRVSMVLSKASTFFDIVRTDGARFRIESPSPVGKFPDWRSVEPILKPSIQGIFEAQELASGLRAASVTADNETRRVNLSFCDEENLLIASCVGVGTSKIRIGYEAMTASRLEGLGLNTDYATDSVKPFSGKIEVQAWAKEKPILFRESERTLPKWVLLMPLA